MALAQPRYLADSMTFARYRRNKSDWYLKEMDFLRYNTELFSKPSWIKDIVEREIKNCEVLRKSPHPSICAYHGVEYDETETVTGLYFDQYDMSLSDVVKQSRSFDAEKCMSDIRAGIEHLHSLSLVHSDIKSHNIFVDLKAQRFVVGDFDSIHEEGSPLEFKTGTTGWTMIDKEMGRRARYEGDWFAFEMVKEWIKKKGNGNPVEGKVYPCTNDILDEVGERKLRARNAKTRAQKADARLKELQAQIKESEARIVEAKKARAKTAEVPKKVAKEPEAPKPRPPKRKALDAQPAVEARKKPRVIISISSDSDEASAKKPPPKKARIARPNPVPQVEESVAQNPAPAKKAPARRPRTAKPVPVPQVEEPAVQKPLPQKRAIMKPAQEPLAKQPRGAKTKLAAADPEEGVRKQPPRKVKKTGMSK
jgi:serine/threonine protein kinase